MSSLFDLALLDRIAFKKFLNSFDTVITDCDGVLYILDQLVPGAVKTVNKLNELNKQIGYVSNNSFISLDKFHNTLLQYGFQAKKDNIVFPTLTLIHYLKEINFTKEAFVFGSKDMMKEMQNSGIQIADRGLAEVEETIPKIKEEVKLPPNIGAVIVDLDFNLNYMRLLKASILLKNSNILFLVGATDEKIPLGKSFFAPGPGYFYKLLENFTGRTPMLFGKPSPYLCSHLKQKFCINDPKRVLYIGDSLHQDMSFASHCGFQKLLVLSGVAKLEEAEKAEASHRPDYYVKNISVLSDMLDQYY